MRITSVTTAGSSGFPYNVVTMLGALLLLWSPTIVAAAAEMLTFPLTRTNATSVVNQYAIEMQLGTIGYARSVYFLPILYSSAYYSEKNGGPKPLYVPSAELCLAQGVWNEFLSPEHGEFVNTISPYVVEWDASVKTKEVNLSLMKGGGAEGKNITVIGSGITNNGAFEWQAAKTKREQNIGDDVEVSLMLWTDNPPQRSYSPTFTMKEFNDTKGAKRLASRKEYSPPGSKAYAQCMTYLLDNGGVYNYTEDKAIDVEKNSDDVGIFFDQVSGWEVKVTNAGTTNVAYQAQEIGGGGLKNITVAKMGVNLMTANTQGMGIVALSEIQRMRNKEAGVRGDRKTNVVAIYLGSGGVAGHVVMGGHDRALIDQTQGSAVFEKPKGEDGQFEVQLVGITYIPDGLEGRSLEARGTAEELAISMNKTQLRLSFNSPTICLPDVILKDLLPHIGAPVYSKELNGYLYEASAKTDYSLRFTLANSTSGNFVNITIPASSLLYRQTTNDNPLTSNLIESGREFLLLAPPHASSGRISSEGIGFLGSAFLQHLYMVDDSHLNKFFISAINTTAIKEGSSNLMTGSIGLIDPVVNRLPQASPIPGSDMGHSSTSSVVGVVLGSVIGGIAILWLIFLFFYLRNRRARSQLSSQAGDDNAGDGEKTLEQGMAAMLGPGGEMGVRGVRFHPQEGRQFDGTAKEVDTPPVATLRGGRQPMSPISPEPNSAGRIMQSPLILSGNSTPPSPSSDKPPPPPVKDEHYFRTIALAHKRFSQPFMKGPHSPLSPSNRKRQSAPVVVLEAGPYTRYLRDNDTTEEIQSPIPIPTYQQLLAHHQARRQRASYIDSESSNGNENDANTSHTSSTETATLGKVISKGQVAKIRQLSSTPPHVALANMLERRASVGRVVFPGEVVIVPPSRRTSRSSKELLQTPRKSISPAASSLSAEGTTESAAAGHREVCTERSGVFSERSRVTASKGKGRYFRRRGENSGGTSGGHSAESPGPEPPSEAN